MKIQFSPTPTQALLPRVGGRGTTTHTQTDREQPMKCQLWRVKFFATQPIQM